MPSAIQRTLADGLLTVLLAPVCAACAGALEHPSSSTVCEPCWASIRPLTPPLCALCGDPLQSWRFPVPDERCVRCRSVSSFVSRGRSFGEYDGVLRSLLHGLKYEGRRSLAPPLSGLMRLYGEWVLEGADCCVPVPLHWARCWRRGFNQAAALATGLGLPIVDALARPRHTSSQADLPAEQRRVNVRNAFRAKRGAAVRGACVVLVDDVSTTGATLEACARVLVEAGAREVRTLTAARVVTRQPGKPPR